MKTLKINEETHKVLTIYKTEKDFKTYDQTIKYLLRNRYKFDDEQRFTIEEYREMMRTGRLPDDK